MKSRVVALAAAALLGGCGSGSAPSGPAAALDPVSGRPGDVVRVDDYPLYFMRTSVDYGFDAYRRRGVGAARAGAVARGAVGSPSESAWACTCFTTAPSGEGPLFGRNLDWWHRASLLLYTAPPNAFASLSMVDLHYLDFDDGVGLEELREQRDRIAQRAPYVPFDGMNEKGVAIGQMAVPSAEPPYDPGKLSLNGLALIRLVLDYADRHEPRGGADARVQLPGQLASPALPDR